MGIDNKLCSWHFLYYCHQKLVTERFWVWEIYTELLYAFTYISRIVFISCWSECIYEACVVEEPKHWCCFFYAHFCLGNHKHRKKALSKGKPFEADLSFLREKKNFADQHTLESIKCNAATSFTRACFLSGRKKNFCFLSRFFT